MFTVLGAVAELERSLISERIRAGLRNAKAKGRLPGPKRMNIDLLRVGKRVGAGESLRGVARSLDVSHTLLWKRLRGRYGGVMIKLARPGSHGQVVCVPSFESDGKGLQRKVHRSQVSEVPRVQLSEFFLQALDQVSSRKVLQARRRRGEVARGVSRGLLAVGAFSPGLFRRPGAGQASSRGAAGRALKTVREK